MKPVKGKEEWKGNACWKARKGSGMKGGRQGKYAMTFFFLFLSITPVIARKASEKKGGEI